MFCWLRFKFVFLSVFVTFLRPSGAPFGILFMKKPGRKALQKRRLPTWKQVPMAMSRGSQRRRLLLFFIKADASRARCLDNNNNKLKLNSIQFNSNRAEVWLRSGWGLAEVWPRSGLSSNCCLSWLRLRKKSQIIRKLERSEVNENGQCQNFKSTLLMIWSRQLGQGPANFRSINISFG